ncbi:hypothetical protein EI94DRAFT_1141194 [Lactarius quietus]|nr:hypothetical protein EI94DRAFT_1141194 [Lactarius quietus]
MNRLNALEANTTLYARYVEEQTSAMREMLRRLSEDVGRLEGIGRAQAQLYERSIHDFERHRREMDIEQRALISQVNYLAEEVVLEKRLGIAQLCLLLAVLVFLSVTRGSPGEFHAPHRRTNSMREWGRRSLGFSGDWVSRLRNAPAPLPHNETIPTPTPRTSSLHPFPQSQPTAAAAAAAAAVPTNIASSTTTIATPTTSRHRRPPLFLTPTHPHHRSSALRSAGISRPRTARSGAASPTPALAPLVPAPSYVHAPAPVRRSSSHGGGPSIGPVPRSARRWARSAHLHEVRRAHAAPAAAADGDVFGGRGGTGAGGKGRSAPVTASVVGAFASGRETLRVPPASSAAWARAWTRDVSAGAGVGVGAAETWVDTDTDTDTDGSEGALWEIDAD